MLFNVFLFKFQVTRRLTVQWEKLRTMEKTHQKAEHKVKSCYFYDNK